MKCCNNLYISLKLIELVIRLLINLQAERKSNLQKLMYSFSTPDCLATTLARFSTLSLVIVLLLPISTLFKKRVLLHNRFKVLEISLECSWFPKSEISSMFTLLAIIWIRLLHATPVMSLFTKLKDFSDLQMQILSAIWKIAGDCTAHKIFLDDCYVTILLPILLLPPHQYHYDRDQELQACKS